MPNVRQDLMSALLEETGLPRDEVQRMVEKRELESFIPSNAKVLCSLNMGYLLLMSNGVLQLVMGLNLKPRESELIAFEDLQGVEIRTVNSTPFTKTHTVILQRKKKVSGGVRIGQTRFFTVGGLAPSLEHAIKFQSLVMEMTNQSGNLVSAGEGPLDQISKLKVLLDSGAISKKEFEAKKTKLLDSI